MPPKIARLVGLGAYAVCPALIALYAYVAYLCAPPAGGGIMPVLSAVSWISVGFIVLALIAVHVVIGKQLMHIARGGGALPV
ncbi:MAG: hypothetical protein ABI442_07165 [Gemmatimonadaceae bacterium]